MTSKATLKSQAVDPSTIQFLKLLVKGHSTQALNFPFLSILKVLGCACDFTVVCYTVYRYFWSMKRLYVLQMSSSQSVSTILVLFATLKKWGPKQGQDLKKVGVWEVERLIFVISKFFASYNFFDHLEKYSRKNMPTWKDRVYAILYLLMFQTLKKYQVDLIV